MTSLSWLSAAMAMKKSLGLLSLILIGCSFSALLAFRLIGSHVDSKGVLREPFFLLPLSVLLAGAGAATGIGALAWHQIPGRR